MSNDKKNKNINILDYSTSTATFIGLVWLDNSFYHPEYIIVNTIIGFFFVACGLVSIYKWNETEYVWKINYIKWSLVTISLAIIPTQIIFFIITRHHLDLNVLYTISLINIIAYVLIYIVLTCKKKHLEAYNK